MYASHKTVYHNKKEGKKTLHNFQCRRRAVKGGCSAKSLSGWKVDNALLEYFSQYDEVFISDSVEAARMEQEKQKADAQIQGYKDKLQQLDKREKEVMSHYINGDIDFDSYREMKKQLENDKNFLRAELAKYAVHDDDNQPATINREEVAASFVDNWQGLTNAEKRLFLTNYIKKIFVKNEPIEGSRQGSVKIMSVEFNTF